jgi:hypothetical protein
MRTLLLSLGLLCLCGTGCKEIKPKVTEVSFDTTGLPTPGFHIWKPALKTDSFGYGKIMVITIREGDLYAGKYALKDSIEIHGDTMEVIDMLVRKLQSQMHNVEVLRKEVEKMRKKNKDAYYLWMGKKN